MISNATTVEDLLDLIPENEEKVNKEKEEDDDGDEEKDEYEDKDDFDDDEYEPSSNEESLVASLIAQNDKLQAENKEQLLTLRCLEEKLLFLQKINQQQKEKIQEYESNNFDQKVVLIKSSIGFSQDFVVNKISDFNKMIDKWDKEPPTTLEVFHQTKNKLELEFNPLNAQFQQLENILSQASIFIEKLRTVHNDTQKRITRIAQKKNLLYWKNVTYVKNH